MITTIRQKLVELFCENLELPTSLDTCRVIISGKQSPTLPEVKQSIISRSVIYFSLAQLQKFEKKAKHQWLNSGSTNFT